MSCEIIGRVSRIMGMEKIRKRNIVVVVKPNMCITYRNMTNRVKLTNTHSFSLHNVCTNLDLILKDAVVNEQQSVMQG